MSAPDHVLSQALEAFCRRLVDGSEVAPTGKSWDSWPLNVQNDLRERFISPLYAAAKVIEEGTA
ncbi:hypothetical protein [Arthrobacter sp. RCC_34]|uniref:hypothetical protein n=1 Tax=Arthrobacter sp. RCC_34 TaxID=3239230 RepID=UPI0035235CA3